LSGSRAIQNDAEHRSDILVFTSPELAEATEVTGEVSATLFAASSASDTDWWLKLIDVAPDGRAFILNQGVARARYRQSRIAPVPLTADKIEKYEIDMWATSNVFQKGHRIRLEVTSSNFPYADRNPNAFVDLSAATEKDYVVAIQTVFHDAEHASFVDLPLIPMPRPRHWIETPFAFQKVSANAMTSKHTGV
jgi:putative CocE/NonD family hydrolase